MKIKVSVIVPIYKVEKYIERCVSSLLEQTLPDMEFIFVNDCTPDRSMEILERTIRLYPHRADQVRIIENTLHTGPSSRNKGLAVAQGHYIAFCDSDDWVDADMYEKMYKVALVQKADIVGCDFYHEYEHTSLYCKQDFDLVKTEQLKAMMVGCRYLGGHVWSRLIKRTLFTNNGIFFPQGIVMWEDLITMIKLHFAANKIAYVPEAFYHYIQYNSDSLVKKIDRWQLESMLSICRMMEQFLREKGIVDTYYLAWMQRVQVAKANLLFVPELRDYELWQTLWLESNRLIMKYDIAWYNKCIFILAHHKYYKLANLLYRFKRSLSQRLRTL